MKKVILVFLTMFVALAVQAQRNSLDMSGEWEFAMDAEGVLSPKSKMKEHILLPGSMPERDKGYRPTVRTQWTGSLYDSSFFFNPYMEKYRKDEELKLPFFLTPKRHYVGDAWYRRTVSVPKDFADKKVVLYLERPHITSTLYVNGKEVGSCNSLSVAHEYDVTDFVKAGKKATFCLKINNNAERVGVGQDSHSVTDQTQGNWNGIVGRMELIALPKAYIENVQLTPQTAEDAVRIDIRTPYEGKCKVHCYTEDGTFETSAVLSRADGMLQLTAQAKKPYVKWDEFTPQLYRMNVILTGEKGERDSVQVTFGMRDITTEGKDILVNGRKTMMRGTVENCCFPLTGYPPTDRASWEKLMRKCKEYGINHIRFHSYCPPEVAFDVADELGLYLQPEGPSWPNHGIKLGNGMMIDKYLMEETQLMVEKYGNHPSFAMLSSGNEPAGNWVKWVSAFVDYWRARDPRRIYTGASVGGSWAWQPKNQYHVKAGARGLGDWTKREPGMMSDFRENIDTVSQPFISHETGQWCAFPDFRETKLYTGVNKALNFDIFRDILRDKGMESRAEKFLHASGRLQVLCYKYEMEKTLRTPHYAGFQLLGLNDYSGQGTALVGPLNVFWKEKGYVSSEEWRQFCQPVTVLARLPKFTYFSGDTLHYSIEVTNYGKGIIRNAKAHVKFIGEGGKLLSETIIEADSIAMGNCQPLAECSEVLSVTEPTKMQMQVELEGTGVKNAWNLWVYPHHTRMEVDTLRSTFMNDIYICKDVPGEGALETLRRGGTVLVLAGQKVSYGKGIVQQFTPVFWNTSWFKMKPPHTTGMYIEQEHPLFRDFPTEDFSDMQWWALMNRQTVMLMDDFPKDFQPIVQPIDTWFLSRKLGMLFEANVGRGKILVSSMPFDLESPYPAVQQMSYALLKYIHSTDFRPKQNVDFGVIEGLFTKKTPDVNMYTNDSPDELKKGVR